MLTHRNLVANLCQIDKIETTGPGDVVLGILPFFHIFGITVIVNAAFSTGATVIVVPRFEAQTFLGILERHRITQAFVPPPLALLLAKHPAVDSVDLSALRVITSAPPHGRRSGARMTNASAASFARAMA